MEKSASSKGICMLNPSDPTVGRGLVLFAAIMFAFSIFLATRGAWQDASLWSTVSIFLACFGLITLDWLPRLRRLFLVVGLTAGIAAFAVACWLALTG
jgi:hypothetical protein